MKWSVFYIVWFLLSLQEDKNSFAKKHQMWRFGGNTNLEILRLTKKTPLTLCGDLRRKQKGGVCPHLLTPMPHTEQQRRQSSSNR